MSTEQTSIETVAETREILLQVGREAIQLAGIDRKLYYADGRRENDAEHSFMLGMIAPVLAHRVYPGLLDEGLISQYCDVHELPENITGDVATFGMSDEEYTEKQRGDADAARIMIARLPEPLKSLLERYEAQKEPEARFVKYTDKMMPYILQIRGDGRRAFEELGVITREQYLTAAQPTADRLRAHFAEFTKMHELYQSLIDDVANQLFPA